MKVKLLSHVRLLATPWTAAYQAPPSMGFTRQEYWSRVPLSLIIFKFRLKQKIVGKITRPFRYDLKHISYDYTVEVTNRFKGLDIRVPEKLWTEVRNIVQEVVIKIIPKKKKCKKAKWLSEEVLQIAVKRREAKGKREKERYIYPFQCRVPKNSKKR